ncbi:MAG TPA: hemolysin III family protein, partial [Smithellaceae bacterium]|nr:hemolysin III family protein [Smithellaceae bacterium]
WSLSVFGIVFKTFFIDRFKVISTLAYIGIGWLVVFAAGPLFQALPGRGIAWLVTGGLAYTLGTIFYAWRTLPFNHAVWHLFVLCGSICHFMAVFFYVIPAKA